MLLKRPSRILAHTAMLLLVVVLFSACQPVSSSTPMNIPEPATNAPSASSSPIAAIVSEQASSIKLTQFDGSELILTEMPTSICAHSYGLALIFHELGLNVTSMMTTSRPLPEALAALPTIGSPANPDFELIKSYGTDFFISTSTFRDKTEQFLSEQGIPACYLDISLYSDTRRNIEMIGTAFGKTEEMNALLADIDAREKAVLDQIQDKPAYTIAIIMGNSKSFLFSTQNSYIGEMAGLLGLSNIVQDAPADVSSIDFSMEQLVQHDPDVILRVAHGTNWEEVKESFNREFEKNEALKNLTAVKNGMVFDMEAELFTANAGTRSIESLETLANTIFDLEGSR